MGASIKRDIHKRDRAADARYEFTAADASSSYTPDGIERLLRDVYAICERETYAGDLSATVIRLDLEAALSSNALTPRQRQVIALRYFGQLDKDDQVAQILGIARQSVTARRSLALYAIAAYMSDHEYAARSQFIEDEIHTDTPLNAWLESVAMNDLRWWDVPDVAFPELNEMFPPKNVRVKKLNKSVGRAILKPRAQTWDKEIPCEEVFPVDLTSGYRKDSNGKRIRIVNIS